jgi:phosphate transport system substrate-binding protein
MKLAMLAMTCLAALGVLKADDDLAIVVNKSNPATNLTKAQLKKIILGEQSTWNNGKRVSVALRAAGQAERLVVLKEICGMSEDDLTQFLAHASFAGDTSAPKALATAGAVKAMVLAIPGGIGFVRASEVGDAVKVVSLDGAMPGEDGYKLRVK